ncbi:MAG: DNA primase small subunit PriS [Halobacteriales archaeon]
MNERTRAYLRGRFGDYYRRSERALPPAAERREWGYIPWSAGSTTMIRHKSVLDLGNVEGFLARERPRHVYFSAGRYRDPGAGTMSEKDWLASDLVFDLDADHLPGVDPDTDSYEEMLAACKGELWDLLERLENDFGFEETQVVFSGGRGYHVHVRDPGVRELGRDARKEIVAYVRGADLEFEDLLRTEAVAGIGRSTPADKRTLDPTGGWSRLVHRRLVGLVDDLLTMEEGDALARLEAFDGIGEGRASAILRAAETNYGAIEAGNVDVHPAFLTLARRVFERTLREESAAIDEPVTTDINRLIRFPGSLHGGTGLVVTPIGRENLASFDPLVDAVPDRFVGREVRIRWNDDGPPVRLRGETFRREETVTTVPEYAAVFLMARGRAERETE